jgi:hypothetical protein
MIALAAWSSGIVLSATEEIGTIGREIESRQGIGGSFLEINGESFFHGYLVL